MKTAATDKANPKEKKPVHVTSELIINAPYLVDQNKPWCQDLKYTIHDSREICVLFVSFAHFISSTPKGV